MSFYVTDDGIKIYYEIKGQGRPLVFIHGWLSNSEFFTLLKERLGAKFKVVTFDIRGHGKSQRVEKGLTLKRFALDLRQLFVHLDLHDVTLVGWSMGASVLFEYVKNFGTSRLAKVCIVEMSPKLINENGWDMGLYHGTYTHKDNLKDLNTMCDNWMDFVNEFMKRALPCFNNATMNPMLSSQQTDSAPIMTSALVTWLDFAGACFRSAFPYVENFLIKPIVEQKSTDAPHVVYATWIAMTTGDYRSILQTISVPSLILYGEKSTLYSEKTAQYFGLNIRNSKIVKFENCTHFLLLENPAKFVQTIEEFSLEKEAFTMGTHQFG